MFRRPSPTPSCRGTVPIAGQGRHEGRWHRTDQDGQRLQAAAAAVPDRPRDDHRRPRCRRRRRRVRLDRAAAVASGLRPADRARREPCDQRRVRRGGRAVRRSDPADGQRAAAGRRSRAAGAASGSSTTTGSRAFRSAATSAGRTWATSRSSAFWEQVRELDLFVFSHGLSPLGPERMTEHELKNFVGLPIDTAVTVGSMVFGGVYERLPGLKVVLLARRGHVPVPRRPLGPRLPGPTQQGGRHDDQAAERVPQGHLRRLPEPRSGGRPLPRRTPRRGSGRCWGAITPSTWARRTRSARSRRRSRTRRSSTRSWAARRAGC